MRIEIRRLNNGVILEDLCKEILERMKVFGRISDVTFDIGNSSWNVDCQGNPHMTIILHSDRSDEFQWTERALQEVRFEDFLPQSLLKNLTIEHNRLHASYNFLSRKASSA